MLVSDAPQHENIISLAESLRNHPANLFMFLIRYLWLCQFFPVLCYYEQYQNEHTHTLTHTHTHTHTHTPLLFASIWGLYLYALITQSCLTHCHPMDRHLPGSFAIRFSREKYWRGLPLPPPEDLPDLRFKPGLLHCRQILYHLSHQGSLHLWKGNFYAKGLVFLNMERYWQIPLQMGHTNMPSSQQHVSVVYTLH